MITEDIQADLEEFRAMLQRIPDDSDPENQIARRIYKGLIEERLALVNNRKAG